MSKTTLSIALTGHRPNKLGGYNLDIKPYHRLESDLIQFIEYKLQSYDIIWGHSGLALGADTLWSKAILAMKEKYPNRVFLHAEIPMWAQSDPWINDLDVEFWKYQIKHADRYSVYDKSFHKQPTLGRRKRAELALNLRNRGMIDHADLLLAIYYPDQTGGTANAIDYAKSINKEIVEINPSKYFNKQEMEV